MWLNPCGLRIGILTQTGPECVKSVKTQVTVGRSNIREPSGEGDSLAFAGHSGSRMGEPAPSSPAYSLPSVAPTRAPRPALVEASWALIAV